MFGMGFTEIMVIAVIAILFLGPDKLPQTMVDIARFFRSAKRTIASAKESIEEELHMDDIKHEVNSYKSELLEGKQKLTKMSSLDPLTDEFDTIIDMTEDQSTPAASTAPTPQEQAPKNNAKPDIVTFSKKKKPQPQPDDAAAGKED